MIIRVPREIGGKKDYIFPDGKFREFEQTMKNQGKLGEFGSDPEERFSSVNLIWCVHQFSIASFGMYSNHSGTSSLIQNISPGVLGISQGN